MKDFNYNDYLKNNPLLKENISPEQADEIARQSPDFDSAVAKLEDMGISMHQAEQIASQFHEMSINEEEGEEINIEQINERLKARFIELQNYIYDIYERLDQAGHSDADSYMDLADSLDNIIVDL